MKRAAVLLALAPSIAWAGYTDTAPPGVFLLDVRYAQANIRKHWSDEGELGPLMDEIERYEPGGGLQGVIIPNARARFNLLISMLAYGVTEDLTLLFGAPVMLTTTVDPELGWIEGDYSLTLGRRFSEQDFWEWAGSMGQPRPGQWQGNKNTPGDVIFGARWRFSDHVPFLQRWNLRAGVSVYGSLRTGTIPDPEELAATGTAAWHLHAQGEAGIHVAIERTLPLLDDRITVGVELFHEAFFKRTYVTPTGQRHPLLLTYAPYAGDTYQLDPGDFTGAELGIDVIAWRGPQLNTWLTRADPTLRLPPILTFNLRYNFTGIGQSDWTSDSPIWDWQNEKFWGPGYKNIIYVTGLVSLLRVGAPVQLYVTYRNLSLLPGKNSRAPVVWFGGLRVPLKFW